MSKEVSESVAKALLADPDKFLADNVVMMDHEGEPSIPIGPFRYFDLDVVGAIADPSSNSPSGALFTSEIGDASLVNGNLLAYYLPWAPDAGYYVVLDPDDGPDLMFTATLNGCAVGYVRAGDGAVRVSHHNIQGDWGTDDAAQKQSLGFAPRVFHKSDYNPKRVAKNKGEFSVVKEKKALIYGVRQDRHWRLFAQIIGSKTSISNREEGKILRDVKIVAVGEF